MYNFIYGKLVKSDDDLIGMIAYSIYKQHKIEFITNIKDEQGREPTDAELSSFFTASNTSSQLDNYRLQAETMLSVAVGNTVGEELSDIEEQMYKSYKASIKECLPSKWHNISLGIISGLISTFIFAAIAVLFYLYGATTDRSTHDKVQQAVETFVAPNDSI